MKHQPRQSRPGFSGDYGITETEDGMLPWSWADERLAGARNYWIVTSSEDGAPNAAPVWGIWADGAVHFSTSPRSRKGRNLERDPRVLIHLDSGDEVVILAGEVAPFALDEQMAHAYEAKYDWRPEDGGGWFRLQPRRALAWLERDYVKSATRFDFDG